MRAKSWSRPKRGLRAARTSFRRVSCWTLPASIRSRARARLWAYRRSTASAARRTHLLSATGARNAVLGIGTSEGRADSWHVAGRPSGSPTLQERRVPGGAAPTRCGWVGREPRWAAGRLLILLLNRGRVGGAAHHVLVLGRRLLLGAGSLG